MTTCRLHRPPLTCLADVWRNSARCDDDNSRLSHLFISLMSIAFLSFFWLLNVKRGILGHLFDFKNGNRTTFYREAYILYYIYPQYTFSRFDQHFSRFVSAFSILFRNFATEIINNLKLMSLWKRKKKRKCSSTSSWWTTLTEEQTMFHSKTGRLHLTHRVNIIIVL